ncbi:alpha-galactosidase [Lacticaseibacillus rhamnosus]|nr:alpha-galactosidase [Lacticaseibacillus rhamnosus]RXS55237.1 alpha-galactosidase [Lacticaseibacillus rhamnosus]TLQ25188.1 alpha-galactosidase [Lacticaseibacillus rhamnosus]
MLATAEATFPPITRSPAQKSACKDLRRNGQSPAITPEATCVLVYAHNALTGAETCV